MPLCLLLLLEITMASYGILLAVYGTFVHTMTFVSVYIVYLLTKHKYSKNKRANIYVKKGKGCFVLCIFSESC